MSELSKDAIEKMILKFREFTMEPLCECVTNAYNLGRHQGIKMTLEFFDKSSSIENFTQGESEAVKLLVKTFLDAGEAAEGKRIVLWENYE